MTELLLIILAIIAVILTVWLVVIPAEVVVGFFKSFRHGGTRRRKVH